MKKRSVKMFSYSFTIIFTVILFFILCLKKNITILAESVALSESINELGTITVDTIYDLKEKNIAEGTVVSTLGYSNVGDNGNANYLIKSIPSTNENDITVIKMNNGLYADLIIPNSNSINVAVAGIFPENSISQKLNCLIELLAGRIGTIQFNDGTYYIDDRIYLDSLSYIGTGNTTLCVSNSFPYADDQKIISTSYAKNRHTFDINLSNINFYYPTSDTHNLSSTCSLLLSLEEINSCSIDNCNFISESSIENSGYMRTTLVFFKHSKTLQNISITNSTFKNLSGKSFAGNNSDYITGGCLFVCGPKDTSNYCFNNFTINNCVFENSTNDEAIAFWNGNFNNICIKNSTISNSGHPNNNLVTFYNGEFHNILFDNNSINITVDSKDIIEFFNLTNNSNFTISNTTFTLNNNTKNPWYDTQSIIRIGPDKESYNNMSLITVNNCSIISNSTSEYRCLFTCANTNNKTIILTNSVINANLCSGLLYTFKSNNSSFLADNNDVNTYNYLFSLRNSEPIYIEISNNTIHSKSTGVLHDTVKGEYKYTDNISNDNKKLIITKDLLNDVSDFNIIQNIN